MRASIPAFDFVIHNCSNLSTRLTHQEGRVGGRSIGNCFDASHRFHALRAALTFLLTGVASMSRASLHDQGRGPNRESTDGPLLFDNSVEHFHAIVYHV
jgi:hypothetical protein